MFQKIKSKLIGDRHFYRMVLMIAVPIMVQNGITHFVNLLDNIMVGRIGTESMSGVAIVNQLLFVYNLCIFGGLSGAGIFTAQYYGKKDHEGIRHTFRFKVWLGIGITVIAAGIFLTFGNELISLYLNDANGENVAATLRYGSEYLKIMLIGIPAFMAAQIYASTLRECGETVVPMIAGIAAVLVNLVFNYILIYGKFGFPMLGVVGAAIATAMSRYVEFFIVMIWAHSHKTKYPYMEHIYGDMKIPAGLVKEIFIKGTPLLLNEAIWSMGMATLAQCYSMRGLSVVAGQNISSTIGNLFNVVFIALGNAVSIVVGQLLGAGKMDEAVDTDNKMIAFAVFCCTGIAVIMFILAPLFPMLYNTDQATRDLATGFIRLQAVFMPQNAFLNAAYFTLRSGGKTMITFFFDSGYICVVSVPIAFVLSRFTGIPVLLIFMFVQMGDWLKCLIGIILLKKKSWVQKITIDA